MASPASPAPEPVPGPSPAPAPSAALSFGGGDQVVITCGNSSSPICFNTAISGANLITSLWFSAVLGALCYLGFVLFRAKFRFYQARLNMPQVTYKPPPMKLSGLHRTWSWLRPVFSVSDEELLLSAGMDALVAIRIISFGVLLLLPMTVVGLAALVPINFLDDWYAKQAAADNIQDTYTTVFIRLTMSNITPRSPWLWAHFLYVYAAVFWSCWLITEHYKEYITLRQAYVVRSTELPSVALGGSTGLLPSPATLPPARSAHRRKQLSGKASPDKAHPRGRHGKKIGTVRLPPRDASGGSGTTSDTEAAAAAAAAAELRLPPSRLSSGLPRTASHAAAPPHPAANGGGGQLLTPPGPGTPASHGGEIEQAPPPGPAGAAGLPQRCPEPGRESGSAAPPHAGVVAAAAGRGADWTTHDFSMDLMPSVTTLVMTQPAAAHAPEGAGRQSAPGFPNGGVAGSSVHGTGRVGQPLAFPATGTLPPNTFDARRGSPEKQASMPRVPSNAAVAAALENLLPASAAEALAKIRHHRQASGASYSGASGYATPAGGTTTPPAADSTSPAPAPVPNSVAGAAAAARPAGLAGVIEAVAAQADGPACGAWPDDLPTALAMEPGLISPRGQEGVAHRWWSTFSSLGNRAASQLRRTSNPFASQHSITFKGAVPVKSSSPASEALAANASLYTVLVTDQPAERLRLKRPLGTTEFWNRQANARSDLLGLQATHTEEVDAAALGADADALERGQGGAAAAAAGGPTEEERVAERGIGLSAGWGASCAGLRQWWRHRGRYQEWRRDVRWAMFNKRVRTATDMFVELFGDDFDAILPIYPTHTVDRLIHQWDAAAARLERLQLELTELQGAAAARRGGRSRRAARVKARILELATAVGELQTRITKERDAVLSDLPSTCFFATFKSQKAAAVAAQANLNPLTSRLFNVEPAPSPDDVNWPALTRSWWQRQARPVYVLPLILFIMLLPIGAFTGAFAQLTIAICGNPTDGSPGLHSTSWFCGGDSFAAFLRNLLTSFAPSLLLSIYHMCILPVLVYYAAQAEGQCFSLSKLDRRCADLFFYWDVFNVFLGAMLGGSILSELSQYVERPANIWTTLSSAIPASSNFFINYVSYRAFCMTFFRLFYPHQAILSCIFKWLHIIPWAKTARDKAVEAPVRNCRYGRDVGIPVLMTFVMVLAYAVVSPLILPFGLFYFMLTWAVWRYQMLYVYQRQYESGGQMWPLVAHKVVGCCFIMVIFTAVVLVFKAAYVQAAIMLATLPIYLLRFDIYLTNRYDAVVAQVPLMAVHAAGRVESVDANLWTPAPLRQGAEGWNPEWGKVWQWWGVPLYTL